MPKESESAGPIDEGATAVITHRVRTGYEGGYEAWLDEITPICKQSPGLLDWQIVRPLPGLTSTYTVILRFDTLGNLEHWRNSEARKQLIEKVRPLLVNEDDFFVRTGLDFWFTPEGARTVVPVRWKQGLVTFTAIYPLTQLVPPVVLPVLRFTGLPAYRPVDGLIVTAILVVLMVYVIMPRYTRLIQRWLFR